MEIDEWKTVIIRTVGYRAALNLISLKMRSDHGFAKRSVAPSSICFYNSFFPLMMYLSAAVLVMQTSQWMPSACVSHCVNEPDFEGKTEKLNY